MAHAHVPFPYGGRCAGGQATAYPADEPCTWKGWGGVKDVIEPVSDPGIAELNNDPDGDGF